MKKLSIILGTSLIFAGICAATLSIFPVQESQAQTYYPVHQFTRKAAYASTPCPATGGIVTYQINMDPSESGPCDCPHFYNGPYLTTAPIRGFKCAF